MINILILDPFGAQKTFKDDPFNTLFAEFFISNTLVLQPISATQSHGDTAVSNRVGTHMWLFVFNFNSFKLNTITFSSLF